MIGALGVIVASLAVSFVLVFVPSWLVDAWLRLRSERAFNRGVTAACSLSPTVERHVAGVTRAEVDELRRRLEDVEARQAARERIR